MWFNLAWFDKEFQDKDVDLVTDSDVHRQVCAACESACRACASSCGQFPEEEMRRCEEICLDCADACGRIDKSPLV